jgi:hypothetical protein
MATTIRSTALDFDTIKNNLKTYLAAKEEFTDYNFEASGLSNILDVLAYNTHINALVANFALNESYLSTAQLRSSVVSLSEGIGYVPDTDTASQGIVNISLTTTEAGRSSNLTLPARTNFTATVDDVSYTFQTIEDYTAADDGTGFYSFVDANGSSELKIYEGTQKTKTFIVGKYEDNPVYVIPETTIDADTVEVRVYESVTSSTYAVYTNIINATTINSQTTIYILKEAPNGYFELSFGDGETFGIAPAGGAKIEVIYLNTNGAGANGASTFTASSQFSDTAAGVTTPVSLSVTTVTNSVGGDDKESIESIRKNAPFQYAAQNRMVTAADYSSLILRNYSTLIKDIKAWGGEDNLDPEFGAVYVSIDFEDDVTALVQANTKQAILNLADDLAVISFRLRFEDPITTFIEVQNFFQFNPRLTDTTVSTVESNVRTIIQNYFTNNVGGFEEAFRRSNLLTLIDESNNAILSSRATIKMQQRFEPTAPTITSAINTITNFTIPTSELNQAIILINNRDFNGAATIIAAYSTASYTSVRTTIASISSANTFNLRFPAAIASPDDENYIVTSSTFTYNGVQCKIQNKLESNTLQIVATGSNDIVLDNLGSYNAATGIVQLTYFTPTAITGGVDFIKLSVTPANPSAIVPERNNILEYDRDISDARAVSTIATN